VKNLYFLLTILASFVCAFGQKLEIELDKQTYLVGEPITASFLLINNSEKSVYADCFGFNHVGTEYGVTWEIVGMGKRYTHVAPMIMMHNGDGPCVFELKRGERISATTSLPITSGINAIPFGETNEIEIDVDNQDLWSYTYIKSGDYTLNVYFATKKQNHRLQVDKKLKSSIQFKITDPQTDVEKNALSEYLNAMKIYRGADGPDLGLVRSKNALRNIESKYLGSDYSKAASFYLMYHGGDELAVFNYIARFPNDLIARVHVRYLKSNQLNELRTKNINSKFISFIQESENEKEIYKRAEEKDEILTKEWIKKTEEKFQKEQEENGKYKQRGVLPPSEK
jgi:hypothetical protein